jgi:hypothetical protein
MLYTLRYAGVRWMLLAAVTFGFAAPAFAQAPTEAQREAIRSDCRNDYMAHCASVPPGGAESLLCLQKNMSSLSGTWQAAVRAVEAPAAAAAPKPETPPAATTTARPAAPAAVPGAAASAPAKQPSSAQISAVRTACSADYPKVCAGVPTGGAPALQCLEKNKAKVSAKCQQAVTAATGGATPPATGGTPAAAAAATAAPAASAPTTLVLRPMLPREELFVLRSACRMDVGTLCNGVAPGGGRILQCLSVRSASLSPACRDVLAQFAAQ